MLFDCTVYNMPNSFSKQQSPGPEDTQMHLHQLTALALIIFPVSWLKPVEYGYSILANTQYMSLFLNNINIISLQ